MKNLIVPTVCLSGIFLQKCTIEDFEYNPDDYNLDSSIELVAKQVLPDIIQECPKPGDTCCIPEIPKIPKCEDFEGYACTSEDVRFKTLNS